MRVEVLSSPSKDQLQKYGPIAPDRMLDWYAVNQAGLKNVRVAIGDFASQPQSTWRHSLTMLQHGMSPGAPVDCGEVGAREMRAYFQSPESMYCFHSIHAMQFASRALLKTCLRHDASLDGCTEAEARERIRKNRNMAPVSPLAILDIESRDNDDAWVHVQTAGDVFFALNSGGRVIEGAEGMIDPKIIEKLWWSIWPFFTCCTLERCLYIINLHMGAK